MTCYVKAAIGSPQSHRGLQEIGNQESASRREDSSNGEEERRGQQPGNDEREFGKLA